MSGPDDRYTDPVSGVLHNRLGIQDAGLLEEAETAIVFTRIVELQGEPVPGAYDFEHLCAVHRRLFGDVYEWAGEPREVSTAKGRSMFPPPQHIQPAAQELFGRLARERRLEGLGREQLVGRLAFFMGETHAIHAFREGNSRSGRAFYGQLARERGLEITWDEVPRARMEDAKEHAMHVDSSRLERLIADHSRPADRPPPIDATQAAELAARCQPHPPGHVTTTPDRSAPRRPESPDPTRRARRDLER